MKIDLDKEYNDFYDRNYNWLEYQHTAVIQDFIEQLKNKYGDIGVFNTKPSDTTGSDTGLQGVAEEQKGQEGSGCCPTCGCDDSCGECFHPTY